ncbi:DUF397 domain-containing protein [Streptomyces sp. NPDC050095]|uniref:DUF397 domain-containing protein n=1 Tax=unclassified Streptomyces TaxID=2593676 RepID=UPI0034352B90
MSTSELHWFKSSYSSSSETDSCVEVALTPATIHVRDSKHPHPTGPRCTTTPRAWRSFIAYAAKADAGSN